VVDSKQPLQQKWHTHATIVENQQYTADKAHTAEVWLAEDGKKEHKKHPGLLSPISRKFQC
jgi:hypothetical protein